MNLGMYICSFHFVQQIDGRRRYVWNLNDKITQESVTFENTRQFFESFFMQWKNPDDIDDKKRVYYIETDPSWMGETNDHFFIMARIQSGAYGVEAQIFDRIAKQNVGTRSKDQADVMPFLFYIAIPKDSGDATKPVNKGIMLFQSSSVYGVKSITTELLKKYARESANSALYTYNVAPGAFLHNLFQNGELKSVRLIKNKISRDRADTLSGIYYGKEERIMSKFYSTNMEELIQSLIAFGMNKNAVYEIDGGDSYQEVKVNIQISKGITRTVDLHRFDNRSILEMIPDNYQKANGHADEEKILPFFQERASEYLRQMAVTLL